MTDTEKILDILALVQSNLMGVREDVKSIDNRLTKLEVKIETNVEAKLDTLSEGHAAILEQLVPCSRVDELENEVRFLKRIVCQITDDMEKLKKAQ